MPCINDDPSVLFCKFFRAREIADLHASGLPELNALLHIKDRFSAALADMDVDWSVIVAVERKLKSLLLENLWHG